MEAEARAGWVHGWWVIIPVPVVLAGLFAVQLLRAVPSPLLIPELPSHAIVPGAPEALPWPGEGQAALALEGVGELGRRGAVRPVPIGSCAKVMTAYLVLRHHPLRPGEPGPGIRITAADVADYRSRLSTGQSQVKVIEGEVLTEREALEALLVPSANNVAHLLARWDAGSVERFIHQMNETAHDLGMGATRYTDPSGFDPGTVSTALDQLLLARKAMALSTFAQIVAMPRVVVPVVGAVSNYNPVLGELGVVGIKTGSTDQSGGNLIFASRFQVDGSPVTLLGAVLGQKVGTDTHDSLRATGEVTRALVRTAQKVYRPRVVLPAGTVVGWVWTAWGEVAEAVTRADVVLPAWPGLASSQSLQPARISELPLQAGTRVGTVEVSIGGRSASVPAVLAKRLSRAPLVWRLTRAP